MAIASVLLVLVVQLVLGGTGAVGSAAGGALVFALFAGWIWIATLFVRAGPSGLLAFLLLFGSLLTFGYAILSFYTAFFSPPAWIAISAALFILAITLGVYGYLNERTTRNDDAGKQSGKQPELG
jgi:hypothetical protein